MPPEFVPVPDEFPVFVFPEPDDVPLPDVVPDDVEPEEPLPPDDGCVLVPKPPPYIWLFWSLTSPADKGITLEQTEIPATSAANNFLFLFLIINLR
ncbi:MAG: hypothetical protein II547_04050 [Treponema sp.]|nr:hypothetical protein [Treponema sp.]